MSHRKDKEKDKEKEKEKEKEREKKNGSSKKIEEKIPEIQNYPPSTQDELRAVLLEFMCSENFEYPIDGRSLFKLVKESYKKCEDYRHIMKELQIGNLLNELKEK